MVLQGNKAVVGCVKENQKAHLSKVEAVAIDKVIDKTLELGQSPLLINGPTARKLYE